ncbi:dentin sialophosphoprotein-like isoform X1 [Quillaja saponaria]|uniref:Dentin sialophosphoprotein-like isoform X1 n=1 Tax=Quillaja saponaria TaxID=32244 RepID=A0AAD7M410_QUISA|nr:dentin sialophosphoprotein-like isoform X1 [Quillaja saponaria]KAJ7969550.1 dentin sialophosphoprotein-like isoform X1 [Quillaja saponaria]
MNYQSVGRYQRPKGANIKQALQLTVLLVGCIWLLYQFKHSSGDESGNTEIKFGKEYGGVLLGRKGKAGWLDERSVSDSEDTHLAGEARDGDGARVDDGLDGNLENMVEEGIIHQENVHRNETLGVTEEVEEVGKESEMQYYNVLIKNKEVDSSEENSGEVRVKSRGSDSDHKDHRNTKYLKEQLTDDAESHDKELKNQVTEPRYNEQIREISKSVFSTKENDGEDEDRSNSEETTVVEVHGFHDENGVPQDVDDFPESKLIVSMVVQDNIVNQEANLSLSNASRISIEINKSDEVPFREENDVEIKSESTRGQYLRRDATADIEIESESSIKVDTSSIKDL